LAEVTAPKEGFMPGLRSLLRFALVAFPVVATGCAANEISFFIVQNQQPIPAGTICQAGTDPAAVHLNEGTLDVTMRDNYVMYPLFRSELLSSSMPMANRPETRGVFVDGAVVRLYRNDPTSETNRLIPGEDSRGHTVYFTAFVPPATGGTPSYAVGQFELLRPQDVTQLRSEVCAGTTTGTAACPVPTYASHPVRVYAVIEPFGHTMGGIDIDAGAFTYPITVCCHCLVQFPPDADAADEIHPGPDCLNGATATFACTVGQDVVSDCRSCIGPAAVCQPTGFTPNPNATNPPTLCPLQ
jgi:hypothetical protein